MTLLPERILLAPVLNNTAEFLLEIMLKSKYPPLIAYFWWEFYYMLKSNLKANIASNKTVQHHLIVFIT